VKNLLHPKKVEKNNGFFLHNSRKIFTFAPSCKNDIAQRIYGVAIRKIFFRARESFSWHSRKTRTKE
jgi:hypothetical protein